MALPRSKWKKGVDVERRGASDADETLARNVAAQAGRARRYSCGALHTGNWRDAGKCGCTAVSAQTGASKRPGFSYERPHDFIAIGARKSRSVYATGHAGQHRAGYDSAPKARTTQAALDQQGCYLPSTSTAASSCCSLITGAMACSLSAGCRSINFTPCVLRPASRMSLTNMRTI